MLNLQKLHLLHKSFCSIKRHAGEDSDILKDNTKLHEDVAMGPSKKTEQKFCKYFSQIEIMGKGGGKVAVVHTPSTLLCPRKPAVSTLDSCLLAETSQTAVLSQAVPLTARCPPPLNT